MPLVEEAIWRLAPGGWFVHLTAFADRSFELAPRSLVRRELSVLGSRYCSKDEFSRAAELVADGTIEPVVTEVVDLDGVASLLEQIEGAEHVGRGAVVP